MIMEMRGKEEREGERGEGKKEFASPFCQMSTHSSKSQLSATSFRKSSLTVLVDLLLSCVSQHSVQETLLNHSLLTMIRTAAIYGAAAPCCTGLHTSPLPA